MKVKEEGRAWLSNCKGLCSALHIQSLVGQFIFPYHFCPLLLSSYKTIFRLDFLYLICRYNGGQYTKATHRELTNTSDSTHKTLPASGCRATFDIHLTSACTVPEPEWVLEPCWRPDSWLPTPLSLIILLKELTRFPFPAPRDVSGMHRIQVL